MESKARSGRSAPPGGIARAPATSVASLFLLLAIGGAFTPPATAAPSAPDFGPAIDPYASYDAQDTCDPTVKPGVGDFREMVLAEYSGTRDLGIGRACHIGSTSEHKEGRAWDWGVRVDRPAERAAAEDLLKWLLATDKYGNKHALARRFGIMYIIWDREIWGSYRASEGWRTYTGSNPHTDHVHFSFSWDGAMKRTTWWTKNPSDGTAPKTTVTLAGTEGDNLWYVSSVKVTLKATDGGSGVADTHYRVDGGSTRTYSGPFTLTAQGVRTVDYWSVDKAGNREATRTVKVRIDTVNPLTDDTLTGTAGSGGWWRSTVTVKLAATDATSGVARATATRDGASFTYSGAFSVTGDGAHTVTYRSEDVAGNLEPVRSVPVRIDATAPVTTVSHGSPSHDAGTLYVSSATKFTLDARDATSGVETTSWTWRGATQAYAGAFTLGGADGAATLSWRSADVAGNAEASKSLALFLDNTPPSLSVTEPADGAIIASLSPTRVAAQASDSGSGLSRVEFYVDGKLRATDRAAPFEWDWATGDEALGEHAVTVRAVDRLGHATAATRTLTTVPTSQAGVEATALRAQQTAAERLERGPPVVGVVVEPDTTRGTYRAGVTVDEEFKGVEGKLPPRP